MASKQTIVQQIADIKHPSILAIIQQKYKLSSFELAQKRLAIASRHFITSKEQPADGSIRLWIRGFAVTTPQKKKGYLGHYAIRRIRKLSLGYWTLIAEKDDVPLDQHPQRRRARQTHPDWGNPLLRAVRKGKCYSSIEAAQAQLNKLHKDYPETTIPTNGKLHVIIYEKRTDTKARTHKYTLSIAVADTKFVITAKRNEHKNTSKPQNIVDTLDQAVKGQFTAQVMLKKHKRWAS